MKVKSKPVIIVGIIASIIAAAVVFRIPIRNESTEVLSWVKTIRIDTYEVYEDFIIKYPNSKRKTKAISRQEESLWREAKESNDTTIINKYDSRYPSGKYTEESGQFKEAMIWDMQSQTDNIIAYLDYLRLYPDGNYAKEAQERIDDLTPIFSNGEGTIGSSGGIIKVTDRSSKIAGAEIRIPPIALEKEEYIKISIDSGNYNYINNTLATIVNFEPSGLKFKKPVEITLPIQYEDISNLSIVYFDSDSIEFEELYETKIDTLKKTISAVSDHFSKYVVWKMPVKLEVEMLRIGNHIAAKLHISGVGNGEEGLKWINNSFLNSVTNPFEPNAYASIENSRLDVYSCFRVSLIENQLIGGKEKSFSKVDIKRSKTSGTSLFNAEVRNPNTEYTYTTGKLVMEDVNDNKKSLGTWLSGKPVLFVFDDFTPNPNKRYYIKVKWALDSKSTFGRYTPIFNLHDKAKREKVTTMNEFKYDRDLNHIDDNFQVWKPEANFSISKNPVQINEMVEFRNESKNGLQWVWDYGNGIETKGGMVRAHAYSKSGIYTISLTATNEFGTHTKKQTLTVSSRRNDDFSTFTDPRDGQVYKTVKFGSQIWFAENLNYTSTKGIPEYYGTAYHGTKSNGDKYGRLYTWKEAQSVCPSGWHVPKEHEWNRLFRYIEDNGFFDESKGGSLGKSLASNYSWNKSDEIGDIGFHQNSNNSSGFSAMPGGKCGRHKSFEGLGRTGYWWYVEEDPHRDGCVSLNYKTGKSTGTWVTGKQRFSIRCVRN